MNMHMPQNDEAEMELKYLAAIRYQIISPALNKSIIGIFQDSLLGSYLFTRGNVIIKRKQAMNLLAKCSRFDSKMFMDQKEEYSAYEIISSILPPITLKYKSGLFKEGRDDYATSNYVIEIMNGKMIRGQFEKDSLCGGGRGLIQRINNDFTEEESQVFIDNIQSIVTEYMKTTGYSVGMSDLISNEETNSKISEVIANQKREVANLINQVHLGILDNKSGRTNQEYFESEVNNILNKANSDSGKIARERLNKDNRFVNIVKSGSKGSDLNISQMISCLGQQNVDNKRIPYSFPNRTLPHFKQFNDSPIARGFVESSFIGGLSPEELFFHAMGGRVGLIDTAVKTSQTGYIQRRLIKGMEDVMICYDRSVRNNKQKIIQFSYGGTNFDTIRIETSKFELIQKSRTDIYDLFRYGYEGKELTAMKMVFTKPTFTRYKDQIPELKERTKKEIHKFMDIRNTFIRSVSELEGMYETVYLPISFPQLIQNSKNQFYHNANQTDITPLEAYQLIDSYYQNLKQVFKPCFMFESVFYYYLNPATLLVQHRFTRDSLVFMLEKIVYSYKRSLVNPGEMVGLISAQSIGEPTTQMNLNTFHFAGISTKSNVTRGVPRMEEILALTRNMKNPSMTIYLKADDESNRDKAFDMISRIENTRFKNFVDKCDIYYDPDDMDTLVQMDKDLMNRYREFKDVLADCMVEEEKTSSNRWIIRLSLDKTKLIDYNITLDEIHFTLKSIYKSNIQCFYTDMEEDEVVFRIRLMNIAKSKKMTPSLDEEDQIYMAKSFLHNLLNNIVLRGIQGIDKVNLLQIKNYMIYNEKLGDFERKDIYSLDTLGSNLMQVLSLDFIDTERTYSNSIMETLDVLGIEAARKCLFNEMLEVLCFDGGYVNHHHISLLCDRMTSTQDMISIFRHGINNDNIGPIAKASFEETTEMFLKAARHGELDEMRGVSANIMCGQHGYFGTAAFSVYLNMIELEKLNHESQYKKKEQDIFDELLQDQDDACALPHLKIQHNLDTHHVVMKKDNDFDIEF
jgi:DNA-directed RNA polymerase II subunit RPB1